MTQNLSRRTSPYPEGDNGSSPERDENPDEDGGCHNDPKPNTLNLRVSGSKASCLGLEALGVSGLSVFGRVWVGVY